MFEWADSNGLRSFAYLVVGLLALSARRCESDDEPGTWRPFWYLTGGLLIAMGLARLGDIDGLMTTLFRDRAYESGWYDARRPLQAVVVAALGTIWLVTVFGACWRIPDRRRRYLPMIVMVVTMAAFAAVRSVSLHQVDSLLYRTHIMGVRVVTLTETTLLISTGLLTFWSPPTRDGYQQSDRTRTTR